MFLKKHMNKIKKLPGIFQIGQTVYTKRVIRGWFDHSSINEIPMNAACIITGYYCQPEPLLSSTGYYVKFEGKFSEFGNYVISHVDLKLG